MSINFYKTIKKTKIKKNDVLFIAEYTLQKMKKKNSDLSVHLVGEKYIQSINKKYRKKDKVTDVISFSANEGFEIKDNKDLGDIFICVQFVEKEAKKRKIDFLEEFNRVLIHGILHLLQFDHVTKKQEEEMFGIQESILKKVL